MVLQPSCAKYSDLEKMMSFPAFVVSMTWTVMLQRVLVRLILFKSPPPTEKSALRHLFALIFALWLDKSAKLPGFALLSLRRLRSYPCALDCPVSRVAEKLSSTRDGTKTPRNVPSAGRRLRILFLETVLNRRSVETAKSILKSCDI